MLTIFIPAALKMKKTSAYLRATLILGSNDLSILNLKHFILLLLPYSTEFIFFVTSAFIYLMFFHYYYFKQHFTSAFTV